MGRVINQISTALFTLIKKNKKWFVIFLITALIISVFFYIKKPSQKQQDYQTTRVTRETLIESVNASGQIINSSSQLVLTNASGIIKKVFVKNGDFVNKGDKILEIDLDQQGQQKHQSAWAAYLSAKNNLDSAQTNLYTLQAEMFNQWKTFYNLATSSTYQNADGTPNETNRTLPEFLVAKNNWLAAEAKYKNQENQVNQAKASLNSAWFSYQLASSVVVAPSAGTISDLIYDAGMIIGNNLLSESISSTTKIATIKNGGPIFGKFNVSEIDVSKIKSGQKATVTIDALSAKTFTGEVIAIDKTGEVSSSVINYPLTIKFDTQVEEILPNMSATANIIVNKKINVLAVPSSAIVKQNGSSYLRVLKNNKLILMPVELGISSESKTEILSGVSEGETLIVSIRSNNQTTGQNQSPFSGFGLSGQRIRMR